jgi:hypothetical protein
VKRRTVAVAALRVLTVAFFAIVTLRCGEHHATAVLPPGSPALLRCPASQTQTTSALVTTLGGVVSLGGTVVNIPAGGVAAATTIALTVPASDFMEIDVKANSLASFVFQQTVSITIDYSRCSSAEANKAPLTVWHIDPQTKQLLENMGGTDNKATHSITFSTGHLSGYAVAF